MPDLTPINWFLFAQMVLLAVSKLPQLSSDLSTIVTVLLILVDAALLVFFRTQAGKAFAARHLVKKE